MRNDPFAACVPPQVPDSLSTPYRHAIVIDENVVLLRIVERYALNADRTTPTIDYVLEDPAYLREPVRSSRTWRYAPGLEFIPNGCDPDNARRYTN